MVQSSARFPKQAEYERALARELDAAQAREVVATAADRYNALYSERKHYDNRALRQHLEEGILPGVALYQTLLDDPDTGQAALELAEAALAEGALAGRRSMERLGRLPFYFWLMRVLIKPVMRLNFPAVGWETEWVEASGDALAFNMHRCFYLDVLEGYGVPELTALYCKMDDLTYDGVSRYVRWARKRTLGRGDECCDFRWERVRR